MGRTGKEESGVLWCYFREMEGVEGSELLSSPRCSSRSFHAHDVSEDFLCLTCLNIPSISFFLTCFGFKVHLPALGMRRSVMAAI